MIFFNLRFKSHKAKCALVDRVPREKGGEAAKIEEKYVVLSLSSRGTAYILQGAPPIAPDEERARGGEEGFF